MRKRKWREIQAGATVTLSYRPRGKRKHHVKESRGDVLLTVREDGQRIWLSKAFDGAYDPETEEWTVNE